MANVKIYTTSFCVYCKMAKDFFAKNNIKYEELDVANDSRAREEMIKISHQMGVPVITIDSQVFVGFNRTELEKALKVA
jgi:glutaredoxin 3